MKVKIFIKRRNIQSIKIISLSNFNIIGQMYYSFSTIACVPASKSQKGGMALGAQAGLKKLTNVSVYVTDPASNSGQATSK